MCLATAKKEKGDKKTGYCGYISETQQRAELSRETSARRGELHTRAEAGLCLKLCLYQSQRFDLSIAKKKIIIKKERKHQKVNYTTSISALLALPC